MFRFNVQLIYWCYAHTNRLASTSCTQVGRLWLCTDILKLTINSGASVIKCVKTVGEESKVLLSSHVETNTDIHKMKELNTSFNCNIHVLYTDIWLLHITYIFFTYLTNCNLCKYASCFICDCTSYGRLFKLKILKWCKIRNSKIYYLSKMQFKLCVRNL